MKKKGFTLVELLAVIAILAILVIMALPAVLRMYRQARQNSFENEVKTIFKNTQDRFVTDGINMSGASGNNYRFYANDGAEANDGKTAANAKKLDIQNGSGGTNFHYCVKVDNNGKILQLKVSNGTYSYNYSDTTGLEESSSISSSDIKSGDDYVAVAGKSSCS